MSAFALWSVPIATGLAYVPHFAKVGVLSRAHVFRSTHPREINSTQKKSTDELVARLVGCHANQLESLGVYAAGIAAATAVGVPRDTLSNLASAYVASRALYIVAYAAPQVAQGLPRGLTFGASMSVIIFLWAYAAGNV